MTPPGEVIPAQGQGHLLETSVLTRLHVPAVRRRVAQLPAERLARCDLSDLELGHSARSGAEWLQIQGALAGLGRWGVGPGHLSRALEVQHELAARGQRGRKVPDLVIAAVAEGAGLVVVHYDGDFELIAAVTGQPHEWVVPRGSID